MSHYVSFRGIPRLRSGDTASPSHFEAFAQIKLSTDWIVDEEILGAFALDASIVNQIRAVHDGESFANVVVGNHNGQPRFAEVNDDLLHIVNGNGIDTAEWFVEHQQP